MSLLALTLGYQLDYYVVRWDKNGHINKNNMQNGNEHDTGTKQVSLRLDGVVVKAVLNLAEEEDRSFTNMVERLLKTHPRMEPVLTAYADGEMAGSGRKV